jgi:hypothetical protein
MASGQVADRIRLDETVYPVKDLIAGGGEDTVHRTEATDDAK